jgi:ATP-dependent RNA helicase DDX60
MHVLRRMNDGRAKTDPADRPFPPPNTASSFPPNPQEKKDKKKDKKEKDGEEDKTPMSREAQLVSAFGETIDEVMALLGDIDDVIEFQLVKMANRLPPLSKFSFGRSLDPWQKRVLSFIDRKRSVIVCAPTSSGKTVLSSYVTMRAVRALLCA